MPSTRRSSKHRDARFSSSPRSSCTSGGISLPIYSIPHRYRSQLRDASTVRMISHSPAANTCGVPNEMGHHGKRSRVLFAACTRSWDRFGHGSRSEAASPPAAAFYFAGWRPAGPASRSGAHSKATHDHAKRTQGHRQRHATAGRCRLNAHRERTLRRPPPTPACRPAWSARAFSGRTISGIARAACGPASAARRTERHVNADRRMRTSSRLDPARRAVSAHHARASSARMS
jgi:hypothetical protein